VARGEPIARHVAILTAFSRMFDAGAKGHWISIQWAARDSSELPSADTFMAEAKRALASGDEDTAGVPAWYALNGKTRITSLAAQPPKR
jgi:hypothetical protein